MPPSGDKQIHHLLPYLSQPGQIFKFDDDDNISVFLGEISDPNSPETSLERMQAENYPKKIAQDKNLQKEICVARDESAKIFMVAEKNHYYQIESTEKELPHDIQFGYTEDIDLVLIDSLDERDQAQDGWLNPRPIKGANLVPSLGKSSTNAIFLEC
ncbi:hypothetical protein N7537_010471 [Penicillium hordei]|uniref:Uncharacterized protein n=1 Tax=Penicillium hordei TaxID=40994 RepID=A0AAD6GXM0_9EURO|nr:uncharacterized protein N7537_010471 [Penicillium hordei]KAJ5593567.1 hypothetical protein N7537_010471 [Penicillium hordei]